MPTVMITGANRGLGLGLAKAYLAKGYDVIATARNPEKAKELKALEGPIEVHKLDVTDHPAVDALAEKLKRSAIDILINNAGVLGGPTFRKDNPGQNFGSVDFDGLRYTLEVNSIAPLKVTEAFTAQVAASKLKKVITLTSRMGAIGEMEGGFVAYRSSKAAVNAIMKNISHALKEKGISVAVLHPGWVKTDMGSQAAPVEIADSVKGLIEQIDHLSLAETGCFKTFEGVAVSW